MTFGVTVDAVTAMVAFLHQHPDLPTTGGSAIKVYGVSLPPAWQPCKTILVRPKTEIYHRSDVNLARNAVIDFFCYGATAYDASVVATLLTDLLHYSATRSCSVSGGTVHIPYAHQVAGPWYTRDELTYWHRFTSTFEAEIARYAF